MFRMKVLKVLYDPKDLKNLKDLNSQLSIKYPRIQIPDS